MRIANPLLAVRQTRFGSRLPVGAMTAAFLLVAGNLSATTVNWISGGPNPDESGVSVQGAGYADGDITTEAEYNTPCGIAVDVTGENVILADRGNNVIRLLEFTGPESDTGQAYTLGYYSGVNLVTNFCSNPVGVAIDSSDNIFVLNHGNGKNGTVLEIVYATGGLVTNVVNLTNANGIALDPSDNIYVTINSNALLKITSPGVSNIVATVNQPGASLQGLVVKKSGANAGLIAVCDSARDGIYLINPNTSVVTTNAGFHGQGDFTSVGNTAPSNAATFFQPTGVAEAGDGTLVVTDYGNHRVKVVLANGSVTNLYGVASNYWSGTYPGFQDGTVEVPDYILQSGGIPNVQARMPFGVAFAPDGSVYVTEDYYHIIRHVTANFPPPPPFPPSPPTPTATAGYGQITLTWTVSPLATNYNVKRSTTSNSETTIASTAGTSYLDTNVLDGTTYFYVVSALNTGGEGLNSTEVSATPLFSPAPTNLTVTATNFGSVSLAWAPSAAPAGTTSYNLKRSTSTNGLVTIVNTASTAYSDSTVVNGDTYYYVVTAVNPGGENPTNSNEVRVTVPTPPPPPPAIGWFDYEGTAPPVTVFYPISGTPYITHNDLTLAIEPIATNGPATYYTDDGSNPTTNSPTPPNFVNNSSASYSPLPVTPASDLTIKAVNVNSGGSSAVVTAEFIFQVGNPSVIGDNAAQFTVSDITTNAQFWYTTDGSDPTNDGSGTSIGPISSGQTNSLNLGTSTNLLFKIRGFKANYQPSSIFTNLFSAANFLPNLINFGFASGPGSSHYIASPGQTFYVPVGLSLLPSAPPVYGLQFNVTLTNLGSSAVNPGTINFGSLLGKPDPDEPGYYLPIPPWMFVSDSQPNNDPNVFQYQGDWYQSLVFADTNSENLLGVGWLEVYGRTNLYDTLNQNLLTTPIVDGTDPSTTPDQMVIGSYSFGIPLNASPGDVYQIQIGRPSATTFSGLSVNPYGSPVDIEAPANTNLLGPGSVNALKNVTIGQIKYLVGDVQPANWYNAGDFGSSNLANIDVIRVFDFAAYPIAQPPPDSDLFDALDSSGNIGVLDGATGYLTNTFAYPYPTNYPNAIVDYTDTYDTNGNLISSAPGYTANFSSLIYLTTYYVSVPYTITNIYLATPPIAPMTNIVLTNYVINVPPGNSTLFNGNDTNINQIAFGDGVLDVCDVYVTFQRSLDTNDFVWFQRFWTNGMRVAIATNASSVIAGLVKQSSGSKSQPAGNSANSTPVSITNAPVVNFASGDVQTTAGHTVHLPITASVVGPYPLRVAMLNITVVPLDGSPPLTNSISFSTSAALGTPTSGFTTSDGPGNYAAAWLNSAITGISNNATIGTLNVTIPANATSLSAYAVHFDHASGSPNGLASFPKHTLTGLITLSSRTNSYYNDGIPDSWRLRWFGTIYNLLSVSNASPSGDGINNWKKYAAGVDPNTPNDFPGVKPNTPTPSGAVMSIYWPTVSNQKYAILSSASLFPGNWTTNATITGNGGNMEFDDHSSGTVKFYRVLFLP